MPEKDQDPTRGHRGAFNRPEGSVAPMFFELYWLAKQVEDDLRNAATDYDVSWARLWRCCAVHDLGKSHKVDPMMDGGLMVTINRDLDALGRLQALLKVIEEQLRLRA